MSNKFFISFFLIISFLSFIVVHDSLFWLNVYFIFFVVSISCYIVYYDNEIEKIREELNEEIETYKLMLGNKKSERK